MGQNPCKHLVEDGGRIGEAELRQLLTQYDKDKNGALDYEETELFLKDLCKALNTKYDKHNAARIFNRCDKDGSGKLEIGEFITLFNDAIKDAEATGSEKAKKVSDSTVCIPDVPQPAPSKAQEKEPEVAQAPRPAAVHTPSPVAPEPEPDVTPKQKRYNEAFSGSSKIDRHEIELGKIIGKGQFGEVYIGECRGMECAIKIPNLTVGGAKFDMLLNELEIMKKANNPHVAMFMGACHDVKTDKILIVMELMTGDAEKKCREPGHPLSERLKWIQQACKGQAWLHEMSSPILHLDLKPTNILYDARGTFKVCDFGLSAVLPEGEKTLFMNRMRGTPIYMAPEIMIPGQYPITAKSDTYSMAITAWEMCTGLGCFSEYKSLPPFKQDVHRMGKRPPIPENWPPSFVALMNEMWHPNPMQRPSFKEIVHRLDPIIREVESNEFREKLMEQIQNVEGVNWWAAKFPLKMKVEWEDFFPVFFTQLGRPVPNDPTDLGDKPDSWDFANASEKQLMKYAKKGDLQKAAVEAELLRRKASKGSAAASGNKSFQKLSDSEKELLCLKGLIGESTQNEEGVVEALRFGQLLAYFGPFESNLITRMVFLLQQPYFHGFCSADRAKDLLFEKSDGYFLVRFSSSRWGQVIISVKTEGKVSHLVVQNNNAKFRYKQRVEKWWDTIPALIVDHAEQLCLKNPQDGGPFVSLFSNQVHAIQGYAEDFEEYDD